MRNANLELEKAKTQTNSEGEIQPLFDSDSKTIPKGQLIIPFTIQNKKNENAPGVLFYHTTEDSMQITLGFQEKSEGDSLRNTQIGLIFGEYDSEQYFIPLNNLHPRGRLNVDLSLLKIQPFLVAFNRKKNTYEAASEYARREFLNNEVFEK